MKYHRPLLLLFCLLLALGPASPAQAFDCASNFDRQCFPGRGQAHYIPAYGVYVVQRGDWLSALAEDFHVDLNLLAHVNKISNPSLIEVGQRLLIPGYSGTLSRPERAAIKATHQSVFARQVQAARSAGPDSPFYQRTWVTFYGRPQIPIMGILGEYELDELAPLLKAQAERYDQANGEQLGVMPAFHLVYGMATSYAGADKDYLDFLADDVVQTYIDRAQKEGWAVILDIQIGALSPQDALAFGLPWLKYDNVHLALDPEFALVHPEQKRPGVPVGYASAADINAAQKAMAAYMQEQHINTRHMLIVHQFMSGMIRNKQDLQRFAGIDLAVVADGFGTPAVKIAKYNIFMDSDERFTGLKLFYRWDIPLLNEKEVLGVTRQPTADWVHITPNIVIYQ